jgi:RNA polymerase sigma factor (sigma-70 family)
MADTRLASLVRHVHQLAGRPQTPDTSDAHLLEQFIRCRDEDAFAALVRRHGPLVWRVCRRVLHQTQHAEEVYQATFLVLARRAANIRRPASLASFLYGVAYRLARKARADLLRWQGRQGEPTAEPVVDPAGEAAWRELEQILIEEVQALPEKYRTPVLLCYWEGLTNEEAALRLGWPVGTVKTRLLKARQCLHARLTRRGVSLSIGAIVTLLASSGGDAAFPPGLASAVLRLARQGTAPIPSAAAALADEVVQSMAGSKGKVLVALLLGSAIAVGAVAFAAYQATARRPEQGQASVAKSSSPREPSPAQATLSTARTDRYGDPLPPGALARLGTVRFRHAGWINRLAFSPDGTRLAEAGNYRMGLLETTSGRLVRQFGDCVDALAFLEGGKRILAGGENLIVWDIASGKDVKRLPVQGGLRQIQLSPDGKTLASVGNGGELLVVEAATGAVRKQLDGHEDQISKQRKVAPAPFLQIQSVAFSPDGTMLASACFQDRRVFLWDTTTGKARHTLPGHDRPHVVQFSPDGRLLAVGGHDCLIHLWDVATGREREPFRGHVGEIYALAFSPDGSKLASGASSTPPDTKDNPSGGSTIRLWDLKTRKGQLLPGPERWVRALAFSPDGKLLAAGGSGNSIYLIDLATGKRRHRYAGHEGDIRCVVLSPDGSTLASGGEDNRIHMWDLKTSQEKAVLEGHRAHISGLAFTPDGSELISCGYDGIVRAWDWRHGKEKRRFAETNNWHYGMDLAPDGQTLILANGQLWNIVLGKPSGTAPNYQGFQYRLVFSPDGKRLTVPREGAAVVLDAQTGKEICRFTGHQLRKDDRTGGIANIEIDCVTFAPDGRWAASGGAEGMAFVWDAATGQMLRRLEGHESPIIGIAFSPDGRMVATASGDWRNHLLARARASAGAAEKALAQPIFSPAATPDDGRLWCLKTPRRAARGAGSNHPTSRAGVDTPLPASTPASSRPTPAASGRRGRRACLPGPTARQQLQPAGRLVRAGLDNSVRA